MEVHEYVHWLLCVASVALGFAMGRLTNYRPREAESKLWQQLIARAVGAAVDKENGSGKG